MNDTTQQNTIIELPENGGNASQQQQPGGGQQKESEPLPAISTLKELIPPVEHIELEPEVEGAGVEVVSATPQVTPQAKQAGLSLAKETLPVIQESPKFKNLMTLEQIHELIKGKFLFKDTSKPMLWLALLLLKQYQMEKQKSYVA